MVSAKHALAELHKRGLLPGLDSAWSPWMSATSTPIPTHPHRAKVWERRGQPMSVPAAGSNQRRTVFGALDSASGPILWSMWSMWSMWSRPEPKNGAAFADLLAHIAPIAQRWPEAAIVLVLDNVRDHRSPVVRTWWAQQPGRIIPFWRPVSPPNLNLNLIERVWRLRKQQLAWQRFWSAVLVGCGGAATGSGTPARSSGGTVPHQRSPVDSPDRLIA